VLLFEFFDEHRVSYIHIYIYIHIHKSQDRQGIPGLHDLSPGEILSNKCHIRTGPIRNCYGTVRTGQWRKLHNGELHNLCSSPDIIRQMKSRRKRWAGRGACMGEGRNLYRALVRNT
jgi:hypothetical protein